MSLMMSSRFWPERCTVSAYLRCVLLRPVSSSSSVMPSTPFIGVRISWPRRGKKVLWGGSGPPPPRAAGGGPPPGLWGGAPRATAMLPMHWLVSSRSGATATWMSIAVRERVSALAS